MMPAFFCLVLISELFKLPVLEFLQKVPLNKPPGKNTDYEKNRQAFYAELFGIMSNPKP